MFDSCGIVSFVFCFGIAANIEEKSVNANADAVFFVFSISCIVATLIMIFQKIWCIKYNNEILIFRNFIGIIKHYNINELTLISGERVNRIFYNGKKIIEWDSLLMNTQEEVALCKVLLSK